MLDGGSGLCERSDIVTVFIRRIVDRIEHQSPARAKMLRGIRVRSTTENIRVNLMNPVDHDDGIVHAGQLAPGELEDLEPRRFARLKPRQEPGGRDGAGVAVQADARMKAQMAQDVAEPASDLDNGLAI